MVIKKPGDISSSEITPKETYINRRKFMVGAAAVGARRRAVAYLGEMASPAEIVQAENKLNVASKSPFNTTEKETPFNDITNYNNFYEFSTDKYEPAKLAQALKTRPWTVQVDGLVKNPKTYDIDYFLKTFPIEERIYRHRCVEGWSMVIPWDGFALSSFLKEVEPLSKAKYVKFTTKFDRSRCLARDMAYWIGHTSKVCGWMKR